jgi:hypothetical protein
VAGLALLAPLLLLSDGLALRAWGDSPTRAQVDNILIVTFDGFRWQEMFGGYDAALNTKTDGGVGKPESLAARFDRATPEARRETLLPFIWSVVAREGQMLGDAKRRSRVRVTNGLWFSYPGYNEMLAGFADPRVDSNDKKINPNLTVLEWLNRRPGFEGRVAAFASWDVLPFIVAAGRSGVYANGDGPAVLEPASDRERLLNAVTEDLPPYWAGGRFDAPTMHGALEYLRTRQPRPLRDARRDGRVGARPALRPVPRRRLALRPLRAAAVGGGPGAPGVSRQDGPRSHDRSRPRCDASRLDRPR